MAAATSWPSRPCLDASPVAARSTNAGSERSRPSRSTSQACGPMVSRFPTRLAHPSCWPSRSRPDTAEAAPVHLARDLGRRPLERPDRVRFEKAPLDRVVHGVGQDRAVPTAGARGCDLPIHRAGRVVKHPDDLAWQRSAPGGRTEGERTNTARMAVFVPGIRFRPVIAIMNVL